MAAASKATALADAADMPVPEAPARSAEIVAFQPPMRPVLERVGEIARHIANVVLPPLIVLAITLFVWQLLCSEPGARLPPPTKVVADAWDFIVDPFYDNGGVDKGAFWQISKSLGRVAIGFSFAAVVGIALGRAGRPEHLGDARPRPDLPGAAHRAAARLAAAVAGGLPRFASLGPVRDLHHLDLADHHQHRRSACGTSRRTIATSPRSSGCRWWEVFYKITLPATVPYIFTGLRIGVGLSWLAIVAAEMLIGGVGIGFFIWDAWNSSRISDIIVALVYIGIVGFLLDKLIATVGHFVSHGVAAQ